ncbi:RNA polymerase II transcription factor B subunit 4 [Choanephora cucurbitarum]|uniref:General transcription and DNA repair factor IIH subunit TFB4 n=1 Tax=Choanephora cucurbitarum TaxID=101091 RepID=A0A1C7NFI7_9FUNG|nr:RNA polymerase II transcription factor B subunit 4 [Choanephora cucurbitarum]
MTDTLKKRHLFTDDSNLLVLIIDTNPFAWNESGRADLPLSLDDALNQLLIFINAHLALKYNNKVAVIASHVGQSQFIYPLPDNQEPTMSVNGNKRNANMYPHFQIVTDQIVSNLQKILSSTNTEFQDQDMGASTTMTGALSMALCYINRVMKMDDEGHIKPRILVLSVSPDSAYQYIPLMNCIFSAQKASIPLDVCKVFGEETAFLQQAANITGGVYVKVENTQALLEYLMMAFLPDRYARHYLNLPSQDQVDYRAACFCHKKIVDIGYVCSVCLSIFCKWSPVCSTCKTKFAFRPMLPPAAPTPSSS